MQTHKYCDLLERLKGFDSWLTSLGVAPRTNDRIHGAFDVLRFADEATRKGRVTGEYSDVRPEHLFPLIEAVEAHAIFNAFEGDLSETLANSVRRALSGPSHPSAERGAN